LNDAASQNWASDDLIKDDFAWTVTIPDDIAPGQYVLRHEIIALHSAQDTNGAQNYPQCINIEVTGSGTAEPAGVVATELYTASDPGISLSIYNGLTDYEIPGPAVYSGGASGSTPSTGGSSSGSSSSSKVKSSAPAATSSAPYATSNSTTQASAPTSTEAAETTSESAPEPTGEPTFAGSPEASSTSCTTTITLTGSSAATASATQSSTPIETSDNSEDDSEDDSEEEDNSSDNSSSGSSSGSSNTKPTTTTSPAADYSAVASSVPSSVLDAPIPTASSSSDKADGKPSKALPEGFTLKDLLEWVNYLLSKAYNAEGKHARDVTRR
jgi:cellulase